MIGYEEEGWVMNEWDEGGGDGGGEGGSSNVAVASGRARLSTF